MKITMNMILDKLDKSLLVLNYIMPLIKIMLKTIPLTCLATFSRESRRTLAGETVEGGSGTSRSIVTRVACTFVKVCVAVNKVYHTTISLSDAFLQAHAILLE